MIGKPVASARLYATAHGIYARHTSTANPSAIWS